VQLPPANTKLITFPASQLAQALGCTAQAVRQRLASVQPSSQVTLNGNLAKAWALEALPASLQADLEAAC
jgi:hypothetical protein